MKKSLFCLSLVTFAALTSCSSDSSSENLPENVKYIKTVHYVDANNSTDQTAVVNYNSDGTVSNVTDGIETSTFVYSSGSLTTVTGSNDNLLISELYQAPYDGYEYGEVLQYDGTGNPTRLRLFERDWDGTIWAEYTCDITYDSQANPFLHTLDKAGILDVLDNVDLNFSSVPQSEELVVAKELLPVNNPKSYTIKDEFNEVIHTVVANYVYDAQGYPTSATYTHTDINGDISVAMAAFTYLP